MSYQQEQTDTMEEGQMLPTSTSHTELPVAPSSSTNESRSLRYFALSTLAMAAVTAVSGFQLQALEGQQQHRRLFDSRELSVISRMQDIFNVVIGISVEEDSIGFDKDQGSYLDSNSQCPGNDPATKGNQYIEIPSIWTADLGAFGIDSVDKGGMMQRTFTVEENHTVLENGVMFNVETVPEALPEDLEKPRLTEEQILNALRKEATEFYGSASSSTTTSKQKSMPNATKSSPLVEVSSELPSSTEEGGGTVFASGQGFLAACMTAFAHHLPLALSPDDLWIVIANGFARHVDANAEELRSNFVAHEGKQEIRIREDRLVKGGSLPEQWEDWVFPKFSESIGNATSNKEVYRTLAVDKFSTTTAASQAASEITLMSTLKNYFKFHMDTMCGIPNVRLDGTRDDWVILRERTKTLALYMLPNNTHGDLWIHEIVLPILDEFLHSYDGNPDYCFWQNMIKFRSSGDGSGAYDFLSGWLPTLFPYLSSTGGGSRTNPYLRPWIESSSAHFMGPRPSEIPIQLSSVPIMWNYLGEDFSLHFHAGFRGVHQEADGTIKPTIGWYVTEDPQ